MENRTRKNDEPSSRRSEAYPERKGPASVTSLIAREITQAEIREASALQAIAWKSERRAHQYISALERRLERGASVEEGPLHFDKDLQMVRTRKMR